MHHKYSEECMVDIIHFKIEVMKVIMDGLRGVLKSAPHQEKYQINFLFYSFHQSFQQVFINRNSYIFIFLEQEATNF